MGRKGGGDPCQGKTAWRSKRAALRALHAMKSPQGRMSPYPCLDHWHVGHRNKTWARPSKRARPEERRKLTGRGRR